MNKIISNISISLATLFCLASCGNNTTTSTTISSSTSTNNVTSSTTVSSGEIENNSKAIVVYYSATNNTEKVAQTIAEHINAPLYKLEPVNPYTSADLNYNNSNSRVSIEHNDPNRHVELDTVSFDGFSSAEYVFLGAPVWWQQLSWVVDDFVKLNDFSNKTIIPFGTSASSSFSVDNLKPYASSATWLTRQRFSSRPDESTVTSWVDSLNLSL